MAKSNLTANRVRELLEYNPETGIFTWKVYRSRSAKAGWIAGSKMPTGHITIRIDGTAYLAHRIAWLLMNGSWPEFNIDHKDHNPSNNSFTNLRDVPQTINMQNVVKASKNNGTGILGVSFYPARGTYIAQLMLNGKQVYLRHFKTIEEAIAARAKAVEQFHPGLIRASSPPPD